MTKYIWDRTQHCWVPHTDYYARTPKQRGPAIIPDIDPYVSPMSGAVINTRRERRREMLDNKVIDGRDAANHLRNHDRYRNTPWGRRAGND